MWDMRNARSSALLGAGLAASLLLLATGPRTGLPAAHAQEGKPDGAVEGDDFRFFEEKDVELRKKAAPKIWELAREANKSNFLEYAREQAQRALLYDPMHKDVREFLGWNWEKKRGEWVRDPERAKVVADMKNTFVANKETKEGFEKRLKKWRDTKVAAVNEFIAKQYAALAKECNAKGYKDQAKKGYQRALSLDGKNAEARVGLGFKKMGEAWVTPEQEAAIEKAKKGETVAGTSETEKAIGFQLHKIQSPHFRIEDDFAPEALPDAIKALETLYAYYLADAGLDPSQDVFEGRQLRFDVVSEKSRWDKWVDKVSEAPADKIQWTKEGSVYPNLVKYFVGVLRVETAEHVDTRDPLLHRAVHQLNWRVWGITQREAWLDEGLAYYYTVKVQETTRTHCVQKATERGEYGAETQIGGDKEWEASEGWRLLLRSLVRKKQDVDLRIIMGRPLATLDQPQTVKSWGFVSWLMDNRREEFLEFLSEYKDRTDRDEKIWDVLQRVMGASVDDLDKEWRAFAHTAY